MTIDDIYQMLRQVVIDMAYEPPYQVNSFGVIDQKADFTAVDFGYQYRDFEAGRFWARDWSNGGAKIEELKGEFPLLLTESKRVFSACPDDDEVEAEVWVVIIDKVKCTHCPGDLERTGGELKEQLRQSLRAILAEFYTYVLLENQDNDPVTYEWVSSGRRDLLTYDWLRVDDVEAMYQPDTLEIGDWGNMPDYRGQYAKFRIRFCSPPLPKFNYSNPVVPQLTATKCPC